MNKKAFTLTELLVSIAIIVLIAAIVVPTAAKAKQQARMLECQARLKQWGSYCWMYVDDSGFFPCEYWMAYLKPYNNDDKMRCCPAATKPQERIVENEEMSVMTRDPFLAWRISTSKPVDWHFDRPWIMGSYGKNLAVGGSISSISNYVGKDFSVTPFFLDAAYYVGGLWRATVKPPKCEKGGSLQFHPAQIFCINRHSGFVNCVFLDTSVRKVGLKELWRLRWQRDFDTNGPWTSSYNPPPVWPDWMQKFPDY